MVELRSTVIVTAAPILDRIFKGGAQRVLYDTYHALQLISDNCVTLQYNDEEHSLAQSYTINRITKDGTTSPQKISRQEAITLLRDADLTLSIDRSLGDLPRGRWHILALSNLAYETERITVKQQFWDRVWVLSPFIRDLLVCDYNVPIGKIDIVPPTLSFDFRHRPEVLSSLEEIFKREEIPLSRRLLFPHRSDPAKGIISTIRLLRLLIQDDHHWRLILTAPSTFDDSSNHGFFQQVLQASVDVQGYLNVIPWLPHDAMSELYAMSGCTIMASTLPESFALVAAESISCGTPVVAVEAGALSQKHSMLQAIHFVDAIDSTTAANVVRNICDTRVPQEIATFLHSRFSMKAHIEAVHRAVALLEENM